MTRKITPASPKEVPMPVDPKPDPEKPEAPQYSDPQGTPAAPEIPEPTDTPEDPVDDPFDNGNFPI
jgi:hypothetical protein